MNVLFICTANICRSPVAEAYMRHIGEKLGMTDLVVRSSGTHAEEGSQADEVMRRLMSKLGIDLETHRSATLTSDMVAEADKIYVMTRMHRAYFREHYPSAISKVELIRSHEGEADLSDPVGGSLRDYQRTVDRLTNAIEHHVIAYKYSV